MTEKILKQLGMTAMFIAMTVNMAISCIDANELDTRLDHLEEDVSYLEQTISEINGNIIAASKFTTENLYIVKLTDNGTGYTLKISDGTEITITDGLSAPGIVPLISIDKDGNWICSTDDGETYSIIKGSENIMSEAGVTPVVKVNGQGYWIISMDGGKTYSELLGDDRKPLSAIDGALTGRTSRYFKDVVYDKDKGILSLTFKDGRQVSLPVVETFFIKVAGYISGDNILLNQTRQFKVELSDVADAIIRVPDGWRAVLTEETLEVTAPISGEEGEYRIDIILTSTEGLILHESLTFALTAKAIDPNNCKEFNDFVAGNSENMLLDFSYAGYMHGESAPAEASTFGYTVYDVTDYGAVPGDGKSDREAFMACVEAATGKKFATDGVYSTLDHLEKANAIIYFPEGEFILHTAEDEPTYSGDTRYGSTIQIRCGNIILRGAGRDKTVLVMQDPNHPLNNNLYSSPIMLDFKHNSGIGSLANGISINTPVTANADKGEFSVTLENTDGLNEGTWVCLTMENDDPACVAKELQDCGYAADITSGHDLHNNGVKVYEYHQVRKVDGNVVTFHEPLHHEIDITYTNLTKGYNWCVKSYPHYENVGIEDLTFKGNCKTTFVHHGSWEDDGAYKPLGMTRLVNSWLRRVRFTSVSEACSIINCSNVSVYDVVIDGNRGHSSIRSQASTRVFIGAVADISGDKAEGQFHATGVSKHSIGTVLWRNVWGNDACFEAHATQPRATLIDCCKGGWLKYHQGGDENQTPNHLSDLIVWNFCATATYDGTFNWWDNGSPSWKFLPPVVAGFHGEPTLFDEKQMKACISNGIPVNPESLYEAQLKERCGSVPAWLNSLK